MEDKNKTLRNVVYYFGWAMVGLYIVFGLMLACTNILVEVIPNNRIIIGVALVLYGIFRLYFTMRLKRAKEKANDVN